MFDLRARRLLCKDVCAPEQVVSPEAGTHIEPSETVASKGDGGGDACVDGGGLQAEIWQRAAASVVVV